MSFQLSLQAENIKKDFSLNLEHERSMNMSYELMNEDLKRFQLENQNLEVINCNTLRIKKKELEKELKKYKKDHKRHKHDFQYESKLRDHYCNSSRFYQQTLLICKRYLCQLKQKIDQLQRQIALLKPKKMQMQSDASFMDQSASQSTLQTLFIGCDVILDKNFDEVPPVKEDFQDSQEQNLLFPTSFKIRKIWHSPQNSFFDDLSDKIQSISTQESLNSLNTTEKNSIRLDSVQVSNKSFETLQKASNLSQSPQKSLDPIAQALQSLPLAVRQTLLSFKSSCHHLSPEQRKNIIESTISQSPQNEKTKVQKLFKEFENANKFIKREVQSKTQKSNDFNKKDKGVNKSFKITKKLM